MNQTRVFQMLFNFKFGYKFNISLGNLGFSVKSSTHNSYIHMFIYFYILWLFSEINYPSAFHFLFISFILKTHIE